MLNAEKKRQLYLIFEPDKGVTQMQIEHKFLWQRHLPDLG